TLARELPPGLVDVIVGGHTHAGVAHRVAGIPIIQAFSKGRAFGRVDLVLDGKTHKVKAVHIFPPHKMVAGESYEGAPVTADAAVAATYAADEQAVEKLRARPRGVAVADKLWTSYDDESPLGNLMADLVRQAVPGADVGIQNGGGLRAELDAGPLTYGGVYEV